MHVEVIIHVDGRTVATLKQEMQGTTFEREQQVEHLQQRVGRVITEEGLQQIANAVSQPTCCGRPMKNCGPESIHIQTMSGEIYFTRRRYRCRVCGCSVHPADAAICFGGHRLTKLLAQRICQLATVEHFTRLEHLVADQHGLFVSHEEMLELVHQAGGAAEAARRADVESWRDRRRPSEAWPEPLVRPRQIYVSCDGIMYCTNVSEPDPEHPGQQRLIWQQMKVGCVYWRDEGKSWQKRVVWGRDCPEDFGATLYRVACECGYREATERIFAADGGEWCWDISARYFSQATGILDWYHANQHLWQAAALLFRTTATAHAWAQQAETVLWNGGGEELVAWLREQQKYHRWRGRAGKAWQSLLRYFEQRTDQTKYPTYRARDWQIGSGMIESTAKQLVGLRLKGPGMHWSETGAPAVTALRAQDLNGCWHRFWLNLTLSA
jgi:hypothetical protein